MKFIYRFTLFCQGSMFGLTALENIFGVDILAIHNAWRPQHAFDLASLFFGVLLMVFSVADKGLNQVALGVVATALLFFAVIAFGQHTIKLPDEIEGVLFSYCVLVFHSVLYVVYLVIGSFTPAGE